MRPIRGALLHLLVLLQLEVAGDSGVRPVTLLLLVHVHLWLLLLLLLLVLLLLQSGTVGVRVTGWVAL